MVNQSSLLCDNWAFAFNIIKFFYYLIFFLPFLYCMHCCATSYSEIKVFITTKLVIKSINGEQKLVATSEPRFNQINGF